MHYRRSAFRADFEERVKGLREKSRKANTLPRSLADQNLAEVRDMVFQCTIFQTSAALEIYLKLVIESWAQAVRQHGKGQHLPADVRASFARRRLIPYFKRFAFLEEEGVLHNSIISETDLWSFLNGSQDIPAFFDGRAIHETCAYPSYKNLKRLFARVGIPDIEAKLGRILRRDVEALIVAFQDIRTALAHAAPPRITLKDVRNRLDDQIKLVSAIDRILFIHVSNHGGLECWTEVQ